jgi:hypothetical protein
MVKVEFHCHTCYSKDCLVTINDLIAASKRKQAAMISACFPHVRTSIGMSTALSRMGNCTLRISGVAFILLSINAEMFVYTDGVTGIVFIYLTESFATQRNKYWLTDSTFLSLIQVRGGEARSESRYAEGFYPYKIVQ